MISNTITNLNSIECYCQPINLLNLLLRQPEHFDQNKNPMKTEAKKHSKDTWQRTIHQETTIRPEKMTNPTRFSHIQSTTWVVLKIKAATPNDNIIKVSFRDEGGDVIKELVYACKDGKQKEVLQILEK